MSTKFIGRAALPMSLAALAGVFSLVDTLQARTYSAVDVRGSTFLAKDDIATACDIVAGDYSQEDLGYIRDCLLSSGQFKDVTVAAEGETLVVAVEELNTRPGRVEVGLAYDSRDGIVANLYFERYNLVPGVFGAVDLKFADEVQSLRTYAYMAKALGAFDFGFDTELRRTDFADQGFTSKRALIEPYLAYNFDADSKLEIGLGYRRDEMKDVNPTASALFAGEAGVVDAPYLRFGYRYSSNPSENGTSSLVTGFSVAIDQYFWGLGTDTRTSETRLEANTRLAIADKTSLLLGLRGGVVSAQSGYNTRAVDRFFVGGSDFRGFAPRGLGPKQGNSFVGANNYYVASVEVQRELESVFGTSGRVGLFADMGSAWSLDDTLGGSIDDSRHLRSSIGISLEFDIGKVPVSIFVAKALDKLDSDDTQTLGVSFSTTF